VKKICERKFCTKKVAWTAYRDSLQEDIEIDKLYAVCSVYCR